MGEWASGPMETLLSLSDVSWRHKVRDFSTWKPWAKRMERAFTQSI